MRTAMYALASVVGLLFFTYGCTADSCNGRCGHSLDSNRNCQCNTACGRFGDCCTDYATLCLGATCSDRCGHVADVNKPCQCGSTCELWGDCCSDYVSLCFGSGPGSGTSATLSGLMQDIWDSDTNRFPSSDVLINPSGTKLFTSVNETRFSGATFQAFINLLDNYERTIGRGEIMLETSLQEIETFLDVVMSTEVMTLAYAFLSSKGKVGTQADFRLTLKELWFNLYPRSSSNSVMDSSGFEHAMVGELKGSTVSGFHSWVQLYLQEKAGNLHYDSMVRTAEPKMKGAKFTWFGATKTMGSFFLGVSPEFDMSVYSVCALMHPNARCNFNMQGNSVSIQTWDIGHKDGSQIGSAYPAF